MSRRGDKSLVKIYKDLLISKRELIDLRQSISKTLTGLKQPAGKNLPQVKAGKKICLACLKVHEPAAAQHCKPINQKCPTCNLHFPTHEALHQHKKSHHECKLCHQQYSEHPKLHEAQLCGETRLDCQKCGAKIKRKDIDDHITRCCFCTCHKCKRLVYYKSYMYHMGKCGHGQGKEQPRQENSLIRTKKLGKKVPTAQEIMRSRYTPCSIIL